jgi:hypothetical protein
VPWHPAREIRDFRRFLDPGSYLVSNNFDFVSGKIVRFQYPRHNFIGVRSSNETRRIRIDRVRSLDDEPLDPATTELQPLLRRGRRLVLGFDLDRAASRSFYAESMLAVEEIKSGESLTKGNHMVAVFDSATPGSPPEPTYIGPAESCLAWAREWLADPCGLAVMIEPPGEKIA